MLIREVFGLHTPSTQHWLQYYFTIDAVYAAPK